jgi:ATP-dependent RNA helicase RhlB
MEFKELNLHPDLQRGIAEAEYITCMPVQEQVLTNAFGGQDLYVQSQTGTGKTAAFLIVIFQRLLTEPLLNGKKAIIMVPTRELAVQVEEEAKLLGKYLPFKVGSFYGGVGYTQQQQMLRDNVQVLVGTPGRVLDLNHSGVMNLMEIAFLVLDEADRMFDMGFYPDLRKLIKVIPPADRRQTMLFSATLNAWVKNLAWEYTKSPLEIEIAPETVTVDEVDQRIYHVPSDNKLKLLLGILEREQPESAIIFCNTKRYTEIVAKRLRINGYECEFIIGDLPQSKRLKIIEDIKAGTIRYLVATDVAARGLDIEGLGLVVNYDLPVESENYVHRIGRTARAGKTGKAITLASEQDVYELPAIEKYIGKKIPSEVPEETLYAQDKSENMRIQTDFYEDRHEAHKEKRGSRILGDREKKRRGGERNGRRSSHERGLPRGKSENRNSEYRHENRQSFQKSSPLKGKNPETEDKDISHLSFEERMAYYKQKYGSRKSPEKMRSSREAGTHNGEPGHRRRGRGKSIGKSTAEGGEKIRSGERHQQEKSQKPLPQDNASIPAVSPEPVQRAEPVGSQGSTELGKKGILSRIFGFFKKD